MILGLLVLVLAYAAGLWLATLAHELGHGIAAAALTRQRVRLEVGSGRRAFSFSLGRVDFRFGSSGLRYGSASYERSRETWLRQLLVAAAGPLASAAAFAGFACLAGLAAAGDWDWYLWLGLCLANFRILLVAVWPIELSRPGDSGEVLVSDGLDIWRLWRNRGE